MIRSDYINRVGTRIRKIRQREGLSLQGLAEMTEISQKNLGEIERGRANPTLQMIERIAKSLGVQVEDLTDVSEEKTREEIVAELSTLIDKATDRELEQLFKVVKAILF